MGSNKVISARAKNSIGAEVGDIVEIETETRTVLFYALLVFILPIAVMFVLYGTAGLLGMPEIWRYLPALGGFLLTFLGLWLYSKFKVSKKCDAEIKAILEKNKED